MHAAHVLLLVLPSLLMLFATCEASNIMLLQGGACASTVAALQRLGVMLQVSHPQIAKGPLIMCFPCQAICSVTWLSLLLLGCQGFEQPACTLLEYLTSPTIY